MKGKDMDIIAPIYQKWQNKEQLTEMDFMSLYKEDRRLWNKTGWNEEPEKDFRIEQMKKEINIKKELAALFNCDEKQISTTQEEALSGDIIYHYGDIVLPWLTIDELKFPQYLGGDLWLAFLCEFQKLQLPENMGGNLVLRCVDRAEGLQLPKYIRGYLDLRSLKTAKGVKFPKYVKGMVILSSLTTTEGLELPEHMEGGVDLSQVISAKGFKFPKHMKGNIDLCRLSSDDGNAYGLELPEHMEGNIDFGWRFKSAKGVKFPKYMQGKLILLDLQSPEGLELPEHMKGEVYLNLHTVQGVKFPEHMEGIIDLRNLNSFEGAILPHTKEGRNQLLEAVMKGECNKSSLIESLKQEYQNHPLDGQEDMNDSYNQHFGKIKQKKLK